MLIARLQLEDMATSSVALVCDGAYYDVATLETCWGVPRARGGDFHTRVLSLRREGLDELHRRLLTGERPTEARILPGTFLPLPPCDPDRAAYLQLSPHGRWHDRPRYQHRNCRGLVGDLQPVVFPPGASTPSVEAGLAVLLGEELRHAGVREAERAILGYTLVLDWRAWADGWEHAPCAPDAASQLGPVLVTGTAATTLLAQTATLDDGTGEAVDTGPLTDAAFEPAEALAYLSHFVPLEPGDVVGLGCPPRGRLPHPETTLSFGTRATLSVRGLRLSGWAVRGSEPQGWRRST